MTAERIEFSRPVHLPDVEVLIAEHSSRRWRWFHETYSVCTVLSGIGDVQWAYRQKVHTAKPGEVLLYEPGEVHQNRNALQDWGFRVLFISPASVEQASRELGLPSQPHWKVMHTPAKALYDALAGLHRSLETGGPRLEVESCFAACLRCVLELCAERAPAPIGSVPEARLRRVRDYLHENYRRSLSLEELTRVAGLSRFHLSRAFAQRYGSPPHAYQLALRVARARELLATGVRPANVAAELGFSDQSHFNRHFQSIAAKTPLAYARSVRRSHMTAPLTSQGLRERPHRN